MTYDANTEWHRDLAILEMLREYRQHRLAEAYPLIVDALRAADLAHTISAAQAARARADVAMVRAELEATKVEIATTL